MLVEKKKNAHSCLNMASNKALCCKNRYLKLQFKKKIIIEENDNIPVIPTIKEAGHKKLRKQNEIPLFRKKRALQRMPHVYSVCSY